MWKYWRERRCYKSEKWSPARWNSLWKTHRYCWNEKTWNFLNVLHSCNTQMIFIMIFLICLFYWKSLVLSTSQNFYRVSERYPSYSPKKVSLSVAITIVVVLYQTSCDTSYKVKTKSTKNTTFSVLHVLSFSHSSPTLPTVSAPTVPSIVNLVESQKAAQICRDRHIFAHSSDRSYSAQYSLTHFKPTLNACSVFKTSSSSSFAIRLYSLNLLRTHWRYCKKCLPVRKARGRLLQQKSGSYPVKNENCRSNVEKLTEAVMSVSEIINVNKLHRMKESSRTASNR